MAAFCHPPTLFHQDLDTALFPPPPDLFTFHDHNFNFSSFNNGNLSFHNNLRYPTLSSSYIPPPVPPITTPPMLPLPDLTQSSGCSTHHEFYPYPYPLIIPDVFPIMEQELPPSLPEVYNYQGVGSDAVMAPFDHVQVRTKENGGNGGGRLSAQSMAARVRRRKISDKTLELGKLVPGGHRMNTAEMFQAAFKYVKFLQAQVSVLQLMEPSEELHALVTSRSVQEKLYHADKCIVTRTFGKLLAIDPSRNPE